MTREASGRRVLVVIPQPFYSDRGSPIAIREVVRGYLDLGLEVDILTFPVGEDFPGEGLRFFRSANPFGIRSVPIGFSVRKLLLDLSLSWKLRQRLRAGRYDLVHALEEAAFPAVWFTSGSGTAVIYDMHSRLSGGLSGIPGLRRGPLRTAAIRMEERLFRRARVIVASKGLAAEVREVHPEARVFEWQFSGTMATDESEPPERLREALSIAPDASVVVYGGTFTRYQGIDLLLEAAARVLRRIPTTIFVLIGAEPHEEPQVNTLVSKLGIQDAVRIVPRQPRETMAGYFRMADVLVSPRISGDNIPLKIFDYLSADRPIVATDIPTHRTVLGPSMARLASPTPENLADALSDVLEDGGLAETLRRGASDYARVRLGWPAFLDQLRKVYTAAIAPSEGASRVHLSRTRRSGQPSSGSRGGSRSQR
jgi:glycosyltransferase involved in cell wall biosynthesis